MLANRDQMCSKGTQPGLLEGHFSPAGLLLQSYKTAGTHTYSHRAARLLHKQSCCTHKGARL
eukprot:1136215-Pelagomonas_calceolata.AAC.4